MTSTEDIDTDNCQMVGSQGDDVVVTLPRQRMTPQEALVHAAWLVAIAEVLEATRGDGRLPDFDDVREAVQNS